MPLGVTSVDIKLYADGVPTGDTRTITGSSGSAVFANVRKYNDQQEKINYTVRENPIDGYYATYEKLDTEGYNWKIENAEGSMTGNCNTGNFWVSNNDTAFEVTWDGKKTGNTVTLGDTYGYGIGTTIYNGKTYLMGMRRDGILTLWDITNPAAPVHKGYSRNNVTDYSSETQYSNTLAFSSDGTKMYTGRTHDDTVRVFDAHATIEAMLSTNKTVPNPISSFGINDTALVAKANSLAGDIIELPNGDLLLGAARLIDGIGWTGKGVWIAKKNSDGSYQDAVKAGDVRGDVQGISTNGTVEGLSLVYKPDGSWSVVMVGYRQDTNSDRTSALSYFEITPTINGGTYTVKPYYTDGTVSTIFAGSSSLADAASNVRADCNVSINVRGQKIWENDTPEDRPTQITVELIRNGVPTGQTQVVTADANDNWMFAFTSLPKYDASGARVRYSVREVGTPNGYITTNPPLDPGIGGTANNTIYNTRLSNGTISLVKVDEKDRPLAGAEFTLYASNGAIPPLPNLNQIAKVPTMVGSDGILTIDGLQAGTYFLKETKAPDGYALVDIYYRVVVSGTGTLKTTVYQDATSNIELVKKTTPSSSIPMYAVVNNIVKGEFKLKKIDRNKDPIVGAEFTLTKNDVIIKRFTTGTTGILVFDNLDPGDYVLEETIAPTGYIENINKYFVNVDNDGIVIIRLNDPDTGTIIPHFILPGDPNVPEGVDPNLGQEWLIVANYKNELKVRKVDENGNIIPGNGNDIGAQFTLKGDAPSTYEEIVNVGTNATAVFTNIPTGTYTLRETRVPQGYEGEIRTYKITVNSDATIKIMLGEKELSLNTESTLDVVNKRDSASFNIRKVDVDKNPLEGAKFTLFMEDQTTVVTVKNSAGVDVTYNNVITGKDGLLKFEWLSKGMTYYLKETQAPIGFILDPKFYKVTIDESGVVTIDSDLVNSEGIFNFVNYKATYPETGGIGTIPFFLIGVVFMATAFILQSKYKVGGDRIT